MRGARGLRGERDAPVRGVCPMAFGRLEAFADLVRNMAVSETRDS
jgi:hypothetical protein